MELLDLPISILWTSSVPLLELWDFLGASSGPEIPVDLVWTSFSYGSTDLLLIFSVCLLELLWTSSGIPMVLGTSPGAPLDLLWNSHGTIDLLWSSSGPPLECLWNEGPPVELWTFSGLP